MTFDWSSSEAVGLAKEGCTHCLGMGLRRGGRVEEAPCSCVLRNIFRSCYEKFRYCSSREKHLGHARLECMVGKDGNYCWAMKDAEFVADFCLVSQRSLDEEEYKLFRFYFLLGADWKLCCRRLNTDRGSFFHQLYRIEEKLGRVYRELRPYALFPLDEYFGGTIQKELQLPFDNVVQMRSRAGGAPLRAPLKKAA